MNTLRTTEKAITLINFNVSRRAKANRAAGVKTFDFLLSPHTQRRSFIGSKGILANSKAIRAPKIKLQPVVVHSIRKFSVTDSSLINPTKASPDEAKEIVVRPIIPLTQPTFPKGGASFPSVTKILSATMPAASRFLLDKWKESMIKKLGVAGFNKYQFETFERGRKLHSLLANYLLGFGEPNEMEDLSKDIVRNLWKSINSVVKNNISNVRLVEHIVTHPAMNYRGIVDCVAFYKDELVVIDFKTAEKPKKDVESLYDNPLQVTAYCGALNCDKDIPDHVIDRNIVSGLVVVAYIDGSEASVYYLSREDIAKKYWKNWTERLDQFNRLPPAVQAAKKAI